MTVQGYSVAIGWGESSTLQVVAILAAVFLVLGVAAFAISWWRDEPEQDNLSRRR